MSKAESENFNNDVCNKDLGSESPKKDEQQDKDEQKNQELRLYTVESINFLTNAFILNVKTIFLQKWQFCLIF